MSHFYSISKRVEDAIIDRLTDTNTGLLPILSEMAKLQDVDLPGIDLTENGNQLFRAQIAMDDFLSIGNPIFPSLFVYTVMAEDKHRQLSYDFSGSVSAAIEIFLSTDENDLPLDLQKLSNLFTDALFHVFGVSNILSLNSQGISLEGGLRVMRTRPQVEKGQGWFQSVGAVLPLFVN